MANNKTVFRILSAVILITISLGLSSCQKKSDNQVLNDERINKVETVRVKSGSITPTLSTKTEIKKSTPFMIVSEKKGSFKSKVAANTSVKKGQIIGYIDKVEIKTPVDAIVTKVSTETDIPKNYPLFELTYAGFSVDIKATDFLRITADFKKMKAKFQVQDGIGPEDMLAIVLSSDDNHKLQCLIDHNDDVKLGQLATVVVTAESRNNVMILPVSAVAGRLKTGTVSKVENGKIKHTKVELGATDGAYIEILSGLKVGDEIQTLAPNIDPREN